MPGPLRLHRRHRRRQPALRRDARLSSCARCNRDGQTRTIWNCPEHFGTRLPVLLEHRSTGTRSTTPSSCRSRRSAPWSRSIARRARSWASTARRWAATRSRRRRGASASSTSRTSRRPARCSCRRTCRATKTPTAPWRASTRSWSSRSIAQNQTADREVDLPRGPGVGAVQGHGDPPRRTATRSPTTAPAA